MTAIAVRAIIGTPPTDYSRSTTEWIWSDVNRSDAMNSGLARGIIALLALVLVMTFVPAAFAQEDDAAVDEYAEIVPTGEGEAPPANKEEESQPLPASVAQQVESEGGTDAPILKRVATSSRYGAPQRSVREAGGGLGGGASDLSPSAVSTAVSLVTDGGSGGRLAGLLVVMLLTGILALGLAGYRHGWGPGAWAIASRQTGRRPRR
jgi:hypothetical protein